MITGPSNITTLADLLHSVAAHGLASLLSIPIAEAMGVETEEAFNEQWPREGIFTEPSGAVVGPEEINQWGISRWMQVVSEFLLTPEVEEIVRQIYAARLLAKEGDDDSASLHTIFTTLLYRFATDPAREEASQLPANIGPLVFNELLARCAFHLSKVRERGHIGVGEPDSPFRPDELRSERAAIPPKLDLLAPQHKLDVGAILAFTQQYQHQVGIYYSRISPPNFSHERSYSIDALYVSPRFTAEKGQRKLDAPTFLTRMFRSVLLGSPGSGKSMLMNKLCSDLARNHTQRIVAGRKELTPILVRLRDYEVEKKARRWSFLEFIEAQARSSYQLPLAPPLTFEYLLLAGRALLLFDGLDEVVDTGYRQAIGYDIEMFAHRYPSVPLLVTSREVGYEQAPLDEAIFEVYRLLPFDDEQVREYVAKWFFSTAGRENAFTPPERVTETFLKEAETTADLRTNPLLLSLLCTTYRGEQYIPRRRADIYEKSAAMLFEQRDTSKGISAPLPISQAQLRPLVAYLAYWIYRDERLQAGVTEKELVLKATEYLCQSDEDRSEAERAARAFVNYCRERAWVFAEIGRREDGQSLYQFTSRGFLEYFAASYLVRSVHTPKGLLEILVPRIASQEWDAMAELAFQLSSQRDDEAANQLLEGLVDQSRTDLDVTGLYLLSFAARSLQFLIPGPKVVRTITGECLKRCTDWGRAQLTTSPAPHGKSLPRLFTNQWPAELLVHLIAADPKNQRAIATTLQEQLVAPFNQEEESEALIAFEIALTLLGATTEEQPENSPVFALALDYFEEGRREVVRQLIVDIIEARFVNRSRPVTLPSLLVDGGKAQIEVRTGSVMILGAEGKLVLRVTNGTLRPMGEIDIELTRSAEYDHLSPQRVSIPLLPSQNSTDVCFRLRMKVAGRVSINYLVNGVMRDPPISVYVSRDNPYIYGSPVDEGEFFGRQEELETIVQAVTKPVKQDMLVVGERRTGKTSLLYQIGKRLNVPFIAIYIVLNTCRPRTDDVLDHVLHAIIQSLVERGILESAWRTHEFVSNDFTERVDEVLQEASRKVENPRLILLLDEADFLLEVEEASSSPALRRGRRRGRHQVDERVQRVLRAALQSQKTGSCLRAVVAGTGDLSTYMLQHSSPFFNHFRFIHLKPLSSEETRELIVKPAEMLGVTFSPNAIERISSFSGCQPYYCQALCYEAFAHAQRLNSRLIGDAEVDVAERKICDDFFHAFLSGIWRRATRKERLFLAALVRGEPCLSATNGDLQRLLDWQIVARAQERYCFAAGLFERWTAKALKEG
jgi:Cdc6-like AAA superfamily ATPase